MSKSHTGSGILQEILESYMFNVDDVESATRFFSDSNLLGKSSFQLHTEGFFETDLLSLLNVLRK
ncbi:hypothetical protein Hanom_Chr06g00483371 [Helianthus anomalus]